MDVNLSGRQHSCRMIARRADAGGGCAVSNTPKLCVLTVHGIGFQQPPLPATPGYADVLHTNLGEVLGDRLGGDPYRAPESHGPVYVMSERPGTRDREWGLRRLGTWGEGGLDITDAPLAPPDKPIAHVALVYTAPESISPLLRTGNPDVAGTTSPSLRPRSDLFSANADEITTLMNLQPRPRYVGEGSLIATISTLEDDMITYVCRNDLRERVKRFISEALRRLLARADVLGVVVNAHSQGTVASFDVLQQCPEGLVRGVRALVTTGSPLRKYVDLFSWGGEVGNIASIGTWFNFWDPKDPVADPLDQPAAWRYGDPVVTRIPADLGLFWTTGADGITVPCEVTDYEVDNLVNSSGGGLQAHNYWDNTSQFIPALAALLERAL
jgi:hypothetical protein